MWSLDFWKATAERAIKTLCQSAAALLVGDGVGLIGVNWWELLSIAGLAALVSVLTSIASGGITGGNTSITDSEWVTYAPKHAEDS